MSDDDVQDVEALLDGYKAKVATVLKGTITWDKDFIFLGRTQKGYEIDFDANVEWGCQPSEPLMLSLGACISTDCLIFLQKMKAKISSFKTDITGTKQEAPPQYFKQFDVMLHIAGKNISQKKVERAIALSQEKYCGVSHSLRRDVIVNIKYEIKEDTANEPV
ncbi:MAG: OsmC family protein [Candidatus Magnetominusculus sp. LBB02]|nr:OsmC family protein [Candidatus Magnetominusculus sp. LBB02]